MSSRDHSLEEEISKAHNEIKHYTLQCLLRKQPFTYMNNLAYYGEKYYETPQKDSFQYGLNVALDYYNNSNKTYASKFYSLKKGAEGILRYCWENYNNILASREQYDK